MQALDTQLATLKNKLEGKIDFHGQEVVDRLSKQIIWTTGEQPLELTPPPPLTTQLIAFLVGFLFQSLKLTFSIFTLGFLACLILVVPSYPSFTAHPVRWLAPLDEYGEPISAGEAGGRSDTVVEGRKDR
ncbi:SPOSA6832_03960, partial [Sporobolomyces salmonicolor]